MPVTPGRAGVKQEMKRSRVYFRRWYRKNRERIKEKARLQRLRDPAAVKAYNLKQFGITPEDYRVLHEAQGGLCAACGEAETRKSKHGLIAPLCVDHDHTTGIIRGLLCTRCNLALGHAQDSVERLERLIRYLHRKEHYDACA